MSIDRDGEGPPLRRDEARAPSRGGDDLRATPFTEDIFGDDDYHGRRRKSGAFGLIAGVVFGAAVAAAAGWYVLGGRDGAGSNGGAGAGGVVRAESMPYKVKPEDPGGLQVENQDKLVYERLDKSAKPKDRVENLLPAPEQPKAPPVKKADVPPAAAPAQPQQSPQPTATASKAEDPLAKLVAKAEGLKETPPAAAPAAAAPAADKPMTPVAPAPKTEQVAATPPAAAPPAPVAAAPAVPPAAVPPPPAPAVVAAAPQAAPAAVPAAPAPAATPAAVTPGAMFLQLASARSEDAAMGEWKRISGKNGDLLGNLAPSVVTADLGERGTYYRLRVGPVADKPTADGLCSALASRNVGCIVVRP